jgi:methylglutaconyl-CoA hydratase
VRVIVVTRAGGTSSAGADLNYEVDARRRARGERRRRAPDAALFAGPRSCRSGRRPRPRCSRAAASRACCRCGCRGRREQRELFVTEVRLGIIPALISPFVIARLGAARARRLFLTAETFDARQAEIWGLVDHAVPDADLDRTVAGVCRELARGGPTALAETKRLVRAVVSTPAAEVGALTADWIARLRAAEEGQEGMTAFLEKRPPRWTS